MDTMTPKEMERATALYHVRRAMELAGDDVLVVGERYAVPITAEGLRVNELVP